MRFSHSLSASDLWRFGFSTAPTEEGLIVAMEVSAKDMGLREFAQSHAAGRQDGYKKGGGKKRHQAEYCSSSGLYSYADVQNLKLSVV